MATDKLYCPACGVESDVAKATVDGEEVLQCETCGLELDTSGESVDYEPIGDILFAEDSDLLRVALEDLLAEKKLANSVIPTAISALSDPIRIGLAPIRSSSRPPSTAPAAATVEAATPKSSTLACEMPYTLTPRTAPKAKMPARPSRNTALTSR